MRERSTKGPAQQTGERRGVPESRRTSAEASDAAALQGFLFSFSDISVRPPPVGASERALEDEAEHNAARLAVGPPTFSAGDAEKSAGGRGGRLATSVSASLGACLGHDFQHVRVHADDAAAASARSLDARAYTIGRDIFFDRGEYAPHTSNGRALLAHELTHVKQQETLGGPARVQRAPRSSPGTAAPSRVKALIQGKDPDLYWLVEKIPERTQPPFIQFDQTVVIESWEEPTAEGKTRKHRLELYLRTTDIITATASGERGGFLASEAANNEARQAAAPTDQPFVHKLPFNLYPGVRTEELAETLDHELIHASLFLDRYPAAQPPARRTRSPAVVQRFQQSRGAASASAAGRAVLDELRIAIAQSLTGEGKGKIDPGNIAQRIFDRLIEERYSRLTAGRLFGRQERITKRYEDPGDQNYVDPYTDQGIFRAYYSSAIDGVINRADPLLFRSSPGALINRASITASKEEYSHPPRGLKKAVLDLFQALDADESGVLRADPPRPLPAASQRPAP